MPEESPSNAVLLAKLEALNAIVVANQSMNHESQNTIITQVTKTNGRVTKLEAVRSVFYGLLIAIPSVYAAFKVLNIIK